MEYRKIPNTDIATSLLGMGCMRLPVVTGEGGNRIDFPEAIKLVRLAIDRGVNYIDTAYGYHGGESEKLVGEALKDGYRERVILATKLPVWHVEKYEDMERILCEQLTKLRTDYVDFYLLHALNAESYKKIRGLGAHRFLDEAQKRGKIRYPAFSFHDGKMAFKRIVADYPWKMAQVQMNFLDEFNQATMDGIRKYAGHIGVVAMEPLRGGALAVNVPADVLALYDSYKTRRSPVEWAFRWLYDKPDFAAILSGMTTIEQLKMNLQIFNGITGAGSMDISEKRLMNSARAAYQRRVRTGCTGCEYCMPCPAGVQIPRVLKGLDEAAMFGELEEFKGEYAAISRDNGGYAQCVDCGKCEEACPQGIKIRAQLAAIHGEFSG
jgi:predicted aldo/keto reductase-like oxidoreductase